MPDKVLFLDWDGVLNSHDWWHRRGPRMGYRPGRDGEDDWDTDPVAVRRLNRILDATGAKVVVSSTWRYNRTVEQLQDTLKRRGFLGEVIGVTPDLCRVPDSETGLYLVKVRGVEIQAWLDENAQAGASIAILDDDADMAHLEHRLVKTTMAKGLLDTHVGKVIDLLSGP
jgi:hypothetical protein